MNLHQRVAPELTPAALGTAPVSTLPYHDPDWYAAEREAVFRDTWLMIARESEVAENGAYIVREVEVLGASVLVVRGRDGEVRAFHNICRHRGNRLALDGGGRAARFTCAYHAWTYGLDGALIGVTDPTMHFDLDKADCGLIDIALDSWNGWLFINFAPSPEPLRPSLGGLGEKLDGYRFERFPEHIEFTGTFEANWKVALDAFQESYHLGYMHKTTIGPQFAAGANAAGRLISTEFHGEHHSGSIWGNPEFRPRPIEATAFAFASLIAGQQADAAEIAALPSTINPTRDPDWVLEMNVFFPNTMLFVSRQGFLQHAFWPLSHDRTRWVCRLYYRPAVGARQMFAQQMQASLARDTFLEDAVTIGNIGQSLRAGVLREFRFQDGEVFPRHTMASVSRRVARWREAQATKG